MFNLEILTIILAIIFIIIDLFLLKNTEKKNKELINENRKLKKKLGEI